MKSLELLAKGFEKLDIHYTDRHESAFLTYLAQLRKWNGAYNLTGLKSDEDIIIKHFLDSLLYIKVFPDGALNVADAGAGAGFPGIPVKLIRPDIEMTLIESSRKKAAFLRHMVRVLDLKGVTILEQRLENLGRAREKQYDIVVSRATFSIKEFLELACPYLKADGWLILSKGPKVLKEIKELEDSSLAKKAIREIFRLHLPFTNAERNLVVLECKKNIMK